MFKLSIISASLLLALNSPVKAQLVPIDNKYELGFDCFDSSTLCLDPMSVQSKIFGSSTNRCVFDNGNCVDIITCLLYTSPSPRDCS